MLGHIRMHSYPLLLYHYSSKHVRNQSPPSATTGFYFMQFGCTRRVSSSAEAATTLESGKNRVKISTFFRQSRAEKWQSKQGEGRQRISIMTINCKRIKTQKRKRSQWLAMNLQVMEKVLLSWTKPFIAMAIAWRSSWVFLQRIWMNLRVRQRSYPDVLINSWIEQDNKYYS